MTEKKRISLFVDGSASVKDNRTAVIGTGWVVATGEDLTEYSLPSAEKTTSPLEIVIKETPKEAILQAEFRAAAESLRSVEGDAEVTLYTDSLQTFLILTHQSQDKMTNAIKNESLRKETKLALKNPELQSVIQDLLTAQRNLGGRITVQFCNANTFREHAIIEHYLVMAHNEAIKKTGGQNVRIPLYYQSPEVREMMVQNATVVWPPIVNSDENEPGGMG